MACITHSLATMRMSKCWLLMTTYANNVRDRLSGTFYVYLTRVCIITLTYIHRNFDFWHCVARRNYFEGWFLWIACSKLFGWCVLLTDNNPNSIYNGNEMNQMPTTLNGLNLHQNLYSMNLCGIRRRICCWKATTDCNENYHVVRKELEWWKWILSFKRPLLSEMHQQTISKVLKQIIKRLWLLCSMLKLMSLKFLVKYHKCFSWCDSQR